MRPGSRCLIGSPSVESGSSKDPRVTDTPLPAGDLGVSPISAKLAAVAVLDLDQFGLETLRRWGINHRTDSHSSGKPTRGSIRRGGYQVRRVVTITVATKINSTIDTGPQRARSAVLLVMILRTTATAA